jgi:hypothetical protein
VPSDSHHLTFTQPRALGDRVSDEFTVPVCRIHHRELHRAGNEVEWWQKLNIDPVPIALKLWQHSHADIAATPMRDGVAPAPLAKTPGISLQDQSDRSHDAHADPASTGRGAGREEGRLWRGTAQIADLVQLVGRFLGEAQTRETFEAEARRRGRDPAGLAADAENSGRCALSGRSFGPPA